MESPPSSASGSQRLEIPQLTVTRFVAAFFVVVFHIVAFGHDLPPFSNTLLYHWFVRGNMAVSYFFVLSGFIMVIAYAHKADRINPKEYWIARFARIYPIYLLALLLAYLFPILSIESIRLTISRFQHASIPISEPIHWLKTGIKSIPWDRLDSPVAFFWDAFLIQAYSHKYAMAINPAAWSLSVEMFFYTLFPFIFKFFIRLSNKQIGLLVLLVWTASTVLEVLFYVPKSLVISHVFPPFFSALFLVGMACGLFFVRPGETPGEKRLLKTVLLMLSIIVLVSSGILFSLERVPLLVVGPLAPVFALLIVVLADAGKGITRRLTTPGMIFLGEISYGVYILQSPVHTYLEEFYKLIGFTESIAVRKYGYLIVLILVSWLSFHYVEKPLRQIIIRRWKAKKSTSLRVVPEV